MTAPKGRRTSPRPSHLPGSRPDPDPLVLISCPALSKRPQMLRSVPRTLPSPQPSPRGPHPGGRSRFSVSASSQNPARSVLSPGPLEPLRPELSPHRPPTPSGRLNRVTFTLPTASPLPRGPSQPFWGLFLTVPPPNVPRVFSGPIPSPWLTFETSRSARALVRSSLPCAPAPRRRRALLGPVSPSLWPARLPAFPSLGPAERCLLKGSQDGQSRGRPVRTVGCPAQPAACSAPPLPAPRCSLSPRGAAHWQGLQGARSEGRSAPPGIPASQCSLLPPHSDAPAFCAPPAPSGSFRAPFPEAAGRASRGSRALPKGPVPRAPPTPSALCRPQETEFKVDVQEHLGRLLFVKVHKQHFLQDDAWFCNWICVQGPGAGGDEFRFPCYRWVEGSGVLSLPEGTGERRAGRGAAEPGGGIWRGLVAGAAAGGRDAEGSGPVEEVPLAGTRGRLSGEASPPLPPHL